MLPLILKKQGRIYAVDLLLSLLLSLACTLQAEEIITESIEFFEAHSDTVTSIVYSQDGTKILSSGGGANVMKLWDLSTNPVNYLINPFGHSDYVYSVAMSPNGETALSGSYDGTMKLWDLDPLSSERLISTFEEHADGALAVAFSPDGRSALSGGYKEIKLWDISTATLIRTFEGHADYVSSVAYSPDGQTLLSGSVDNTVKLWDISTGELIYTFKHDDWVRSVAYSPDGQKVLSSGDDKTIKLWNVSTSSLIRTFEGHQHWVMSAVFSPDGRNILSGSYDGTMKLWDIVTGEVVRTFKTDETPIKSVAYSPNGTEALFGNNDNGIIYRWDLGLDEDDDNILDNIDNCLDMANPNQVDVDNDNIGDVCDSLIDNDNDFIANSNDNCIFAYNPNQIDGDGDSVGDACDAFPLNASETLDSDNDNIGNNSDNCPIIANPHQEDFDGDGIGTLCDTDEPSPIYRFWSQLNKSHFFTINEAEKNHIIATYPTENWQYTGISYYTFTANLAPVDASPVYRFYSPLNKTHFFTINEAEKDYIIATYPEKNWKYSGVAWYAFKADVAPIDTIPVYRFYSSLNKTHFFTASEGEKDHIIATYPPENWKYGGIAWYAYK